MTKFVCDFEEVESIANKIKILSDNMIDTTNNLETTVTSDLSTWQGEAHDGFIGSVQTQKLNINNAVGVSIELAEFIMNASKQIQATEDELSSLTI